MKIDFSHGGKKTEKAASIDKPVVDKAATSLARDLRSDGLDPLSTRKNMPQPAVGSGPESSDEDRFEIAADALSQALNNEVLVTTDTPQASNKFSVEKTNVASPRLTELDRQHEFVTKMGADVLQYEMMLHNLHGNLNNFTKFIGATKTEFRNLDRMEAGQNTLLNELELTRRQLQEANQNISIQTAMITEQDKEKKESRKILDLARKELIHAIEQGKTAASALETNQTAFARLKIAKQTVSNNLEGISSQNHTLIKKIEQLTSGASKLSEVNGKLEKQIEQFAARKTDLVKERDQALQQLVTVQTDIGARNHAIASLTNQLDTARQELKSVNEAFEIKTRHREGEILSLKSAIDRSDEQNRQLNEKLDVARLEATEFKTRISTETDKRFELEKRCAEFSEQTTESEKQLETLQSSYDALNARYLQTKSELEKQRASNSDSERKALAGTPEMFFTPGVKPAAIKTDKKTIKAEKADKKKLIV